MTVGPFPTRDGRDPDSDDANLRQSAVSSVPSRHLCSRRRRRRRCHGRSDQSRTHAILHRYHDKRQQNS